MSKALRKSNICYNCETILAHSQDYCPSCGQENHSRQASTHVLISDFMSDYLAFDSKLFRSIIPLLIKPGFITKKYLEGKRQQFIPPIRVFLFLSFIYFGLSFLLNSDSNTISVTYNEQGQSEDAIREIAEYFSNNFNFVIFFFTPILALIIKIFYRTKEKRYYVNFFVFSLHFLSFLFILGSLLTLLFSGMELISKSDTNASIQNIISLAAIIYICVYWIIALKHVFNKKNNILLFSITLLISVLVFVIVMIAFFMLIAWYNGSIQF